MCKSSSLIFVLLFAFTFRLESFSWRLISVMFLIFTGVVLMVATETQFVFGGMILVLTASAFGGLRWALTQKLLVGKHGREMGMDSPASSIYWLAPTMGVSLAVLSMIVDSWISLFTSKFFDGFEKTLETTVFVVAPGVIAFTMVMSEF
jgi:solute carrier family 35 protein C2